MIKKAHHKNVHSLTRKSINLVFMSTQEPFHILQIKSADINISQFLCGTYVLNLLCSLYHFISNYP